MCTNWIFEFIDFWIFLETCPRLLPMCLPPCLRLNWCAQIGLKYQRGMGAFSCFCLNQNISYRYQKIADISFAFLHTSKLLCIGKNIQKNWPSLFYQTSSLINAQITTRGGGGVECARRIIECKYLPIFVNICQIEQPAF